MVEKFLKATVESCWLVCKALARVSVAARTRRLERSVTLIWSKATRRELTSLVLPVMLSGSRLASAVEASAMARVPLAGTTYTVGQTEREILAEVQRLLAIKAEEELVANPTAQIADLRPVES